jgi:NADH:ubiquinone reductase (H+-translocating)
VTGRPKQEEAVEVNADNVLVLGGGLAGVACAQELAKHGVPTTLVDRNDYHQFQPLLYQVATSQLPAEDIARPLRTIFADTPSVQVMQAQVEAVKLSERSLVLADGRVLTAGHLVLAAGARPNFFGIEGAAAHAFPLYSVADAERLRLHLQHQLTATADEPGSLDVVVVGAGPTGVETAGALAEMMAALHGAGRVNQRGVVHIVDRGDRLLPQFSTHAHHYAHRKLTEVGVVPHLGVGVTGVRPQGVDLSDGTSIVAGAVVWGGGESAASVAQSAGPSPGRGGRIDVEADLTVEGFPGVYAVGDVANIPAGAHASSGTLPQLGSVAQQSGRWAAANIACERDGKQTKPFHYRDKGIMAMIGRNAAVAEVGKRHHQVEGPVAFAAWLGVHAMLLSGVHSKTDAFLTWAWDYFDRDHSATVEEWSSPRRIAWGEDDQDQAHITIDPRPGA